MWECGVIGKYEYVVLLFNTYNKFGLEGGRIRALSLIDSVTGEKVVSYAQGWGDLKPKTLEQNKTVNLILDKFS
ncbi:DUF7678 domain-containing protein [Enterococcus sp. LJL128]